MASDGTGVVHSGSYCGSLLGPICDFLGDPYGEGFIRRQDSQLGVPDTIYIIFVFGMAGV